MAAESSSQDMGISIQVPGLDDAAGEQSKRSTVSRSSSTTPLFTAREDVGMHMAHLLPRPSLLQRLAAEFIGTFAMVFAGCGAVVVSQVTKGGVTHTDISLVFGLVVGVMIYATGHISAAHFNPAVTIAFAAGNRFPWRHVPPYILVQLVASITASAVLRVMFGGGYSLGVTLPMGSDVQSLFMEFFLTFFLMFVIAAVATDPRAAGVMAGAAIGGTVMLDAEFGGPVSGASMNPARSLGPAIVSSEYRAIWLYIIGPIAGAVAAMWTYNLIRCSGTGEGVGSCRKNAHGCCE